MEAITIHVSEKAARAYEAASVEQRRKLDALLSLKLMEATSGKQSLEEIMTEMSHMAQERGLTPEILDAILNER